MVHRRNPKTWRAITISLSLVVLFSLSLSAVASTAFELDNSSGTWSNATFGIPSDSAHLLYNVPGPDPGENRVLWGRPASNQVEDKSGLGFIGVEETSIDVETPFQIGTLKHYNKEVFLGSIQTVDLEFALEFADPALTWSTTFTFEIDETPNTGDPANCPYPSTIACSDKISLPTSFGSETIIHDGRKYSLEIIGFQDPDTQETVSELISQEFTTTIAHLIAQIVDVTPEVDIISPEAGQVFALGSGDVALTAEITDPLVDGSSEFTCEIDWGDGSAAEPGTVDDTQDPPVCTGSHTYTATGEYTIEVTVSDQFDVTDSDSVSIYVDVAPQIQAHVDGTLGDNDWYVSDVDISWTITSLSPLISQSGCDDVSIDTDTAGTTLTCTAENGAGENSESVTIKRDATAPTIEAQLDITPDPVTGWFNINTGAPTVSYICDDVTSGIVACPSPHLFGEGAGQSHSGTVYDEAGNSASDGVTGIDVDLTPPVLDIPDDQVLNATSASGAVFNFTPGASDNLDPSPSASCDHSSGMFPVGTTVVSCEATDAAGNSAQGSFEIKVLSVSEQIDDLSDLLDGLNLPSNLMRSLQSKLDVTEASLLRGSVGSACNQLQSFINEVEAQRDKALTAEQADLLVAGAQGIRTAIGC